MRGATATAALLLLILFTGAQAKISSCHEENVEFDGQTHSTSNARAASDCQKQCDSTRCSHWTWKNGRCEIKRIADPGKKIPTQGAVSGGKSSEACREQTKGVACHYVDNKQPILCLFPFKTVKLGSRTEKITHNTCTKTTSGRRTCATKVDLTNTLISSSLFNKDVDCGDRTNDQGELYCSAKDGHPGGSCPELETYKKRVADLERENNELKEKMGSTTGKSASCPAWGKWSSWGSCSKSCLQSRQRTCSKPAEDVEEKKCSTSSCSQSSAGRQGSKTSCTGRCGKTAPLGSCQCSSTCFSFGDCCKDYSSVCGAQDPNSCSGKCGNAHDRKLPCQCNVGCEKYKNCCKDYASTCKASGSGSGRPSTSGAGRPSTSTSGSNTNGVSDAELVTLFEGLLSKDTNNVADLLILNTGCTTRVGNPRDCSTHPLFSSVDTSLQ